MNLPIKEALPDGCRPNFFAPLAGAAFFLFKGLETSSILP